jgi:hypothetical protein
MRYIYNYDPTTGEYASTNIAMPDPLENPEGLDTGTFIVPANATLTTPPPVKTNNLRVFRDGKWGYVANIQDAPSDDPVPPSTKLIDAERDKRIADGFYFDSVLYQARPDDRENIAGAVQAASNAVALGAEQGDFSWQRVLLPTAPDMFEWIAADNTRVAMDAQTVILFGYTAMMHKQAHIAAGRALKDMTPIPDTFNDDMYWPAVVPQVPPA